MTIIEFLTELEKKLLSKELSMDSEIEIEYDGPETWGFYPTGSIEVGPNKTLRILEKKADWGRE